MRKKLIVSICSIILTVLLLEVATRLSGVEIFPAARRMHLDPNMGWHWTPNYRNEEVFEGRHYIMEINKHGLRNEEIVIPKPSGNQRYIALGDSVTAGLGVNLGDTYAKQLQRMLSIEVINAGVDDYGTYQEVYWLENYGLAYKPDLVIIGMYLNDSLPYTNPHPVVAYINNLLINKSMFYTYYYQLMGSIRARQAEQSEEFRYRFHTSLNSEDWKTDQKAFAQIVEQANLDFGLAWDQDEIIKIQQTFNRLIEISREQDFKLLMVIFPVSIQVFTEIEAPIVDQPQTWLLEFAKANDVEYLDLLPILKAHKTEDIYIDQVHLTPHGHTVVAEALWNKLANK